MGAEDDRAVMLRVRSGSRGAFDVLVRRFEGPLIAYFHRQCGDRQTAEDCAQDVFLKLYGARARYSPEAKFTTFLWTIARNHWIDVARARRARPFDQVSGTATPSGEEERDPTMTIATPQPSPGSLVEQEEGIGQLRRALDRLPGAQKDVVLLGVIEGLPYADVAAILGIPVGTVKSRVHAAVQSLRRLLDAPTPKRAENER